MPDKKTAMLRLGMIGCGQISNRFFNWAESLPKVRFVATCAAHEASALAKAEERHCDRWYVDYHKLLADPEVDAVVITTPHQFHARMATDALRAGKHVLVEKPMTTRWTEAQELIQAEKESGKVLLALPFVHYPNFVKAIEFAREEYIGKITGAEAELSFPGPPRSNWYYSREAEGGAMLDTMVYPLSRVAALLGPAKRISAFVGTLIPRRITGDGGRIDSGVDDYVTILLEYATGQQAVVRSWWAQSYMQNGTVLHGRHGAIFMNRFGQPLVVKSDLKAVPEAKPIDYLGLENCYAPSLNEIKPEEDILGHFVDCIRLGREPKPSGAISLHIHEQMMMAYESSKAGRAIDLTSTFDVWWNREPDIMRLDGDYL